MAPARISYSKSPEALVVGLARTGDQDAFAELVRRRQSWIRNLMRRWCGDATLADDLAQQVFLQAWRKISQLQQASSFGAWLKRLALSVWLQHLRKNDAPHGATEYIDEQMDDRPENQGETKAPPQDAASVAMDLDRALASLPVAVRMCLVLAYDEGMSQGEIANLTELPLGTVKSHMRRGAQRLQQKLSTYRHPPRPEENR